MDELLKLKHRVRAIMEEEFAINLNGLPDSVLINHELGVIGDDAVDLIDEIEKQTGRVFSGSVALYFGGEGMLSSSRGVPGLSIEDLVKKLE